MNTRTQIAQQLTAALPDTWTVYASARTIDPPSASVPAVVCVQRTDIAPSPIAQGSYLETFAIWLLEPSQNIDVIDDHLDVNLELVHDWLEQQPWLLWSKSNRDIYDPDGNAYHAYRIEITTTSNKE